MKPKNQLLTSEVFRGGILCRHCNDSAAKTKPRRKSLRFSNPSRSMLLEDKILTLIRQGVEQGVISKEKSWVMAESLGLFLRVPTHHIKYTLQSLNLKGYVSQKINKAPHDSKRDPWGGWDSAWMPSRYEVKLEKFYVQT